MCPVIPYLYHIYLRSVGGPHSNARKRQNPVNSTLIPRSIGAISNPHYGVTAGQMANEPVILSRNPGARLGDVSSNVLDDIRDAFGLRSERSTGSLANTMASVEEKDDCVPSHYTTYNPASCPGKKNPAKVSKAKERKMQSPGQEWVNQIDTESTNRLHKELPETLFKLCFVKCHMPGCKSVSQVNYTFRKVGPFFCHKCHYGAREAPAPVSSALVVVPQTPGLNVSSSVVEVVKVPQPECKPPVVMYGDVDYYDQVIPCAMALPRKLEYYLACADFISALTSFPLFDNITCCCCISYLPCVAMSEVMLPHGLHQVTSFCDHMLGAKYRQVTSSIHDILSATWRKCVSVCVYDEPICIPKHRAPRRHEQVRYDTSQSYLSPEFSQNAKSAIIVKYCLRDLFKFYTTRFIAQRFGSDDECRRALREAADDFPGKDRIDVSVRDVVYNDTIMHFIWHKRQAANARGYVLGAAKAAPEHITLG